MKINLYQSCKEKKGSSTGMNIKDYQTCKVTETVAALE
jgi:hypothetical protein